MCYSSAVRSPDSQLLGERGATAPQRPQCRPEPPFCKPAGKWASRDCMLGMEFSGRDRCGRRVMGLVPAEGLATSVMLSPDFLWDVPPSW